MVCRYFHTENEIYNIYRNLIMVPIQTTEYCGRVIDLTIVAVQWMKMDEDRVYLIIIIIEKKKKKKKKKRGS